MDKPNIKQCYICNGTGLVRIEKKICNDCHHKFKDKMPYDECFKCYGIGKYNKDELCDKCNGAGLIKYEKCNTCKYSKSIYNPYKTCKICDGSGEINKDKDNI